MSSFILFSICETYCTLSAMATAMGILRKDTTKSFENLKKCRFVNDVLQIKGSE